MMNSGNPQSSPSSGHAQAGNADALRPFFDGHLLYGDDFSPTQIDDWYRDEEEGYADLGARDRASYGYGYHAWNWFHAFRHLPPMTDIRVLGFGSAYGDELIPLLHQARDVTIVDPSSSFVRDNIEGKPVRYIKPKPSGDLDLPDNSFNLVTCLGVLHHIPNVSHVLGELARVTSSGGILVIREPIISMGDWRQPRRGLTKRERGIPLRLLLEIAQRVGLTLMRRSYCAFPLSTRVFRAVPGGPFNNRAATVMDWMMATCFAWNLRYHPRNNFQRLRPTSAFLMLRKQAVDSPERG